MKPITTIIIPTVILVTERHETMTRQSTYDWPQRYF